METIRESLLVILTIINAIVFIFVWAGTTKSSIRRVFSHVRVKNLFREWILAGIELIIVSFLFTCFYYYLSGSLKTEFQAKFPMLFMVLTGMFFFLLASHEAVKKKVLLVLLVIMLLLVICPAAVICCIFVLRISMDQYYLFIGAFLILLDLIGIIHSLIYVRKGDL